MTVGLLCHVRCVQPALGPYFPPSNANSKQGTYHGSLFLAYRRKGRCLGNGQLGLGVFDTGAGPRAGMWSSKLCPMIDTDTHHYSKGTPALILWRAGSRIYKGHVLFYATRGVCIALCTMGLVASGALLGSAGLEIPRRESWLIGFISLSAINELAIAIWFAMMVASVSMSVVVWLCLQQSHAFNTCNDYRDTRLNRRQRTGILMQLYMGFIAGKLQF